MKRRMIGVAAVLLFGLNVAAKDQVLVIGATPVPHAEILQEAKTLLAKKGVNLEIRVFTDYITPNLALKDKSLDANYFQHLPFLKDFSKNHAADLVSAGAIHYEPLALYSKKIKTLDELKSGDQIAIPYDVSNEARALILLHDHGVIKLKDPGNLSANIRDIESYNVAVSFAEVDAAQIPRTLGSVAAGVINGNYAIDTGLSPVTDAIVSESSSSVAAKTYANLVAVRKGDEARPEIKELVAALHSEEIERFIKTRYQGAVIPVE